MAKENGFKRINVSKLLEDVNILDVIDDLGLETQRHGNRISILCPCHPDRHFGSCFVTKNMGQFYCFSCHAHGNAIDLVKEVENVDFLTAARRVASICGGESGYYLDDTQDDKHTRLPKEILKEIELSDVQNVYGYTDALTEDEVYSLRMDGIDIGRNWDYDFGDDDTGMYLMKESIAKKPLQELIDDDPEMFDCLVYNKAVEMFESYKNLQSIAKGNSLFLRVIGDKLNRLQRIIDEYEKRLKRYDDEELKPFIYRYKPKRINPFGAIGRCF